MRPLLPLSCALFALASPRAWALPAGVSVAPHPAWVVAAEPGPLSPARPDDPVSWLLVDDQALLDGPRSVRHVDQISGLRSRADLRDQSRVVVPFDPAEQTVQLHTLAVWRDGAWEDRLATARIELIRREDALWEDILDGTSSLVLLPEDVAQGDLLRASWSVHGDDRGFGAHAAASWTLAWSVPVARRQLRVGTPAGAPPARLVVHGTALDLPAATRAPDGSRWHTLDLGAVPAWTAPPWLPPDLPATPWIEATTWPDHAAVVDAFAPRYAAQSPPALAALLAAIDPARDPRPPASPAALARARVVRALRWAQEEVRYLGLEMGAGSHAPRPVSTVLRARYGDCKDKARLLVSMLAHWGIAAWPALVHSGGADPRTAAASPFAFDHVIVAVAWPAAPGGWLWVDPTRTDQGGPGAAPLETGLVAPAHGAALLLRPGTTGLVALPPAPRHRREVAVRWSLADPVEATATTTLSGASADETRAWLAGALPGDTADWQHSRWSVWGLPAATAPLAWEDDRAANTLQLTETVALDGVWQPAPVSAAPEAGPPARAATAQLGPLELADWLPLPAPDRTAPLALGGPATLHETLVIPGLSRDELDWPRARRTLPGLALETAARATPAGAAIDWTLRLDTDRLEGAALAAYLAEVDTLHALLTVGVRVGPGGMRAQPGPPPAAPPAPPPAPLPPWGLAALGALAGLGLGWGLGRRR